MSSVTDPGWTIGPDIHYLDWYGLGLTVCGEELVLGAWPRSVQPPIVIIAHPMS
jgi:hypothetical protein